MVGSGSSSICGSIASKIQREFSPYKNKGFVFIKKQWSVFASVSRKQILGLILEFDTEELFAWNKDQFKVHIRPIMDT